MSSGGFRTSPVVSGEPPLRVRREVLSVCYLVKLRSMPTHLAHRIFDPSPKGKFKMRSTKPLSFRFDNAMVGYQESFRNVIGVVGHSVSPWVLLRPVFV